ncbi:SSXT protein [Ancylostoma ceylanicum]|uniref:SSXT protein n=1 Tax=Ancylostoma ceylanicum TaxID=53326 RepID=A0A0D6M111_9BILA|nr:SSXT protein [Ancylostoma ceylanicum]
MSLAFAPQDIRQGVPDHRSTVQALLNENSSLIKSIRDYLSMGRTEDAAKYQQLLHRNLIHLAQAADQSLLSQLRAMMPPPVMQMQPSVAAMPPTSQPQMGMPMGPPQGYGYPPQGMPPAPQGLPPGQVMPDVDKDI